MDRGAFAGSPSVFLEVKLQGKLDLARVLEGEARGANLAKVGVRVRR
jgi:hypothetical protein